MQASLMGQQERERLNWLKQIEFGLDGYSERHRGAYPQHPTPVGD